MGQSVPVRRHNSLWDIYDWMIMIEMERKQTRTRKNPQKKGICSFFYISYIFAVFEFVFTLSVYLFFWV